MLRVINLATQFNKLPSEILGCDDEYTAFCFDEACGYIRMKLEDEKVPHWKEPKLYKRSQGNKKLIETLRRNNAQFKGR